MRVCVIGVSGSGKTTFATRLAGEAGLRQVELDLINWRPGWVSRYESDRVGFVRDVEAAITGDDWVVAGGYSTVRPRLFARAEHVVWIDIPKWLNLQQVLVRSFWRALSRRPQLNGNVETFGRWRDRSHPVQLVLRGHGAKRAKIEAELAEPKNSHLTVLRCRSRRELRQARRHLVALNKEADPSRLAGSRAEPCHEADTAAF